jgi:hypothetical protein
MSSLGDTRDVQQHDTILHRASSTIRRFLGFTIPHSPSWNGCAWGGVIVVCSGFNMVGIGDSDGQVQSRVAELRILVGVARFYINISISIFGRLVIELSHFGGRRAW